MPLVEKVLDKSNSLVTAETKTALGSGARDLLAKIEGTVQGIDTKVRRARGGSVFPIGCAMFRKSQVFLVVFEDEHRSCLYLLAPSTPSL